MDDLALQLGAAIERAMSQFGLELPIRFVIVSVNGCIIGGFYTERPHGGLDATFTVQHIPPGEPGCALPLNTLLMDAHGRARRIVIPRPERDESVQ